MCDLLSLVWAIIDIQYIHFSIDWSVDGRLAWHLAVKYKFHNNIYRLSNQGSCLCCSLYVCMMLPNACN